MGDVLDEQFVERELTLCRVPFARISPMACLRKVWPLLTVIGISRSLEIAPPQLCARTRNVC